MTTDNIRRRYVKYTDCSSVTY